MERFGVVWCAFLWYAVVWCDVVWCVFLWYAVVWCGVVCLPVVCSGVVCCGVVRLPVVCSVVDEAFIKLRSCFRIYLGVLNITEPRYREGYSDQATSSTSEEQ